MKAHLIRSAFYLLLLLAFSIGGTLLAFFRSEEQTKTSRPAAAGLTFAQRVAYQQAIEDVYWRHRIWPKERPDTKPSLSAVMSQAQLENKVADYLRKLDALEEYWQRPVAAEQLQAEMNRMAQDTKQPEVLHELFEALENDPFVIAECLARPALSERFETNSHAYHQRVHGELKQLMSAASANYALPAIADGPNGCADDTWIPTSITNAPAARFYPTAVWTGSEMIVWGGVGIGNAYLNTGGTYNPSTDSWTATSTTNPPDARGGHTAVWTGSEMIVWGGANAVTIFNTGGRYNPGTNSWTATSTTNAPDARGSHTAVWTGNEMIVWGGNPNFNSGGRYNPNTDSWAATSMTNAPAGRYAQRSLDWQRNDCLGRS